MEHNPQAVLAIGEIALFLIGTILSLILLAILLLPSLMKFTVPHWVKLTNHHGLDLFELIIPKLSRHGYYILTHETQFLVITKDNATRYHIYSTPEEGRLSMFRQGDEVDCSTSTSILAGAGIGWIVILCHQAFLSAKVQPIWGWDTEFKKSALQPFSAVMKQAIQLNPWR